MVMPSADPIQWREETERVSQRLKEKKRVRKREKNVYHLYPRFIPSVIELLSSDSPRE